MSLLEVKGLHKEYKNFTLDNISFDLPKGYIMGYIGENGAGKTTTINLITKLCRAKKGEVKIDGVTYEENPIAYKESIGYVGDESYFPKEFKIKDVKRILKQFFPSFREQEFDHLIQKWNLPENKKMSEFSRGMKVKLMFASILSRDTKILILDEATNGLDPIMRDEVIHILQDYIEDGEKSILFSTHVLADLDKIADYIIFIHQGRLVFQGLKEELEESYLLIKGKKEDMNEKLGKKIIGKTQGEFGFEGIIKADLAPEFGKRFLYAKPNIDQIMLHFVKNGGIIHEGN